MLVLTYINYLGYIMFEFISKFIMGIIGVFIIALIFLSAWVDENKTQQPTDNIVHVNE